MAGTLESMASWGKLANYEIATRVPLIISTPSMPQKGSPSNSVVELIDIYPTLCDLANIPQPDHLAGKVLSQCFTTLTQL